MGKKEQERKHPWFYGIPKTTEDFEDELIHSYEIGKKFSLNGGLERVFNIGDSSFVVVDQLGYQSGRTGKSGKSCFRLRVNGYIDIYYVKEGPTQGMTTQLEILDDNFNCIQYYQVSATDVDETIENFLNSLPEVQP